MAHNHTFGRSSASPAPPATSSSPPSTRVSHWSVFLDHYEVTAGALRRNFELLAASRDLAGQQRLVDDVEQELFDGKHRIESIEHEIPSFPYHLRSSAAAQVQLSKQQLEQHYATLIIYQQRHRQGQVVTPQLLQHDQQAAEAQQSDGAAEGERRSVLPPTVQHELDSHLNLNRGLEDDIVDDTTRLLSPNANSSSSASPSPTSSSPAAFQSARVQPFPMTAQRASLVSTAGHHVDFNEAASRTHSSLLQSADIGQETGRLLAQQRESVQRQQMALQVSDAMSAESSRSMDRTRCRYISDNLIAWLIVALQIGLFSLIARVKYFS